MPNWCFNQTVVYGDKDSLEDFKQKILNAERLGKENETWGLYELYRQFGFDKEQILSNDLLGYTRGSFTGTEFEIEHVKGNEYKYEFWYETAWSPMIEGLNLLIAHYGGALSQVTLCEECGNEIYINTDRRHKFITTKYQLDVVDDDIYYVDNEEELVEEFNKTLEWQKISFKAQTKEDCFKYLANHDGRVGEYDVYIHEYETY